MNCARRRAVAIVLPMLILPLAAHAAPKVGTVTNSNNAVVARDNGKVVPATDNMPLEKGDKVITRDGGSANVQLADRTFQLGGSSMMSANDGRSVSMDNKSASKGGDGKKEAGEKLAQANKAHHHDDDDDHGNHFGHCKGRGHGHHDDDGPGKGHGHGHDHDCPPVSP